MNKVNKRIAILGAAALGELIAYHAENDSGYKVVGFYDDFSESKNFNKYSILGKFNQVEEDYKKNYFDYIVIALGYKQMRVKKELFNKFKGIIPFANVIHSSCYIDNSCKIGEGVVFLPRVVLDYKVVIHDNVLINTGSIIAHHSIIQNNTFIAPGVSIAGYVNISSECFIGIGSIIKDMVEIGKNNTIGAGSVVVKDIKEENTVSVGIPSKIIKQ